MRNPFTRFARHYNHLLNKYKYPTQIVTGGVLWFSGDVLCQNLVHLASSNSRDGDGKKREELKIDWSRVGRMTVYGLAISAPVYGFWYSFLDMWSHRVFGATKMTSVVSNAVSNVVATSVAASNSPSINTTSITANNVRKGLIRRMSPAALRTWKIIGFKLFADCALFDPAYLSLFFTATSAMEGKGLVEIWNKLKQDLGKTYLIDVAVWFPIQTVNFRFVPVAYQPLVVQSCNIGWNAYLSFVQHDTHH